MKRSAIVIVCNGEPFVIPQLCNIYNHVDEIIIAEGADSTFQKIIKSKRSTDGTIESLKKFKKLYDIKNKITIIHTNCNKNRMFEACNKICAGDLIYQVDIDEFLTPETIELAFKGLESHNIVQVPQRWYYKSFDLYMSGRNDHSINSAPGRFYKNKISKGLVISHIPYGGYVNPKGKFIASSSLALPFKYYAYHFLAVFRFQMINKMMYYHMRDNVPIKKVNKKIKEFDSCIAEPGYKVKTYKSRTLYQEEKPFKVILPDGSIWPHRQ